MSSETLEEKTSAPLQSEGRARAKASQLLARTYSRTYHVDPRQADGRGLVPGVVVNIETKMGERESWRVVAAGPDPLLERES